MANETIGHHPCPICDEPAHVRRAKSGKAYLACQSPVCGFQGFCRIDDSKLLGKMQPISPAAAPAPAPVPEKKTTPPAAPAPQPQRKGFWDGIENL